ncbi:uncharacterized protein LOC122316279 [Carya illinoinensis]|uniref:uncharacterized protein LOC122316279 n=1 Tax=Carya illinoinensis TaxID=32201 RepID=UPI001C724374|nr:uncharacterized protein LOC122316279 [Carya illinoinensis]
MEEEELSRRWENFSLSKEENTVFVVSPDEAMKECMHGKLCIVGGVLTEKGFNTEAFRMTMSQIWRLEGWVKFKDLGDFRFLIEFWFLVDKERVLGGRPWFFDRNLVFLQELEESTPLNAVQFQFEPFWVQLHGLTLAVMNADFGSKFASSIGHVIRVEADSEGRAWGKCLRVRVAVDLNKPLLRGKWLQLDNQKHWVYMKYERL